MSKDKQTKEKKNQGLLREILGMIFYLAVVLVISLLLVKFVGQRTEVIGSSMYPTLMDGDNLICDKISYRFEDPERFDIIVFPFKEDPSVHYIKRIIGLPNETVQIKNGIIYINDIAMDEDYGYEIMLDGGIASEPIKLGSDEYFVLGDNRNNSQDSRFGVVGNIKRSDIVGKAWLRVWPFSSFGFLKHQ